jgi:hypothetical protein
MPQMQAAFAGWSAPIQIQLITQTVLDDGSVKDTTDPFNLRGVIQPLKPKEVALKPEGERAWSWYQMHIVGDAKGLKVTNKILWRGQRFKIMASKNYSQNNFWEFHMVEDYQNG